jgi:hypothetical protein
LDSLVVSIANPARTHPLGGFIGQHLMGDSMSGISFTHNHSSWEIISKVGEKTKSKGKESVSNRQ